MFNGVNSGIHLCRSLSSFSSVCSVGSVSSIDSVCLMDFVGSKSPMSSTRFYRFCSSTGLVDLIGLMNSLTNCKDSMLEGPELLIVLCDWRVLISNCMNLSRVVNIVSCSQSSALLEV